MLDLHRHDEFSRFDGFGKSKDLAAIAKELGYTSLGISNHGNTNGLVMHYFDCIDNGLKPILGVECYFQPKFDKEKKSYHLCLFAKNLVGYGNINRIMFEAEKQKYYTGKVTWDLLEKFSDGVICTSACIAGFVSQALANGKRELADKAIKKFKDIYGSDFYIEIQPYEISEKGLQEKVNVELIKLARENKVKCILTSDSHFGKKEDFDTYCKMHELADHDLEMIRSTYSERYMPTEKEIMVRFYKMHKKDFGEEQAKKMAKGMIKNLQEIEDKVEERIFDGLKQILPQIEEGHDSYDVLVSHVKQGLKEKGVWSKEYWERCKGELEVIQAHGFADYFLIVQDYVKWAKDRGIFVGPGRGSVCNSEVAFALDITTVDSLRFGLDFRRFLRMDKKKLPDVDLDFETDRRQEVIDYMIEKFPGHASQICNYGLYKIDNLINDLAKKCGLDTTGKEIDEDEKKARKRVIADIKTFIKKHEDMEGIDFETIRDSKEAKYYNEKYDDIMKHFEGLYLKCRFIGTHAAGVAITGASIFDYTSLTLNKDGKPFTVYDLSDLDRINIVKFDFLGLKTMQSLGELRKLTGKDNRFDIAEHLDDDRIYEEFKKANTDGVFQFESSSAKSILQDIQADCFEDLVAASAMNRPGPLQLKMPHTYAQNKFNQDEAKNSEYWEYTKETYGTIVYQEQLQQICVNIGKMSWEETDKVMKIQKRSGQNKQAMTGANAKAIQLREDLIKSFVKGAMENGYTEQQALDLFEKMLVYTFNKGHAVGYTLISFEEMYYKVYHPTEYWYSKVKYAIDDEQKRKFMEKAVVDEALIFLPHVNYSRERTSLRKEQGGKVIQLSLSDVKGIGEKAANFIEQERKKNGVFTSVDNFLDRCVVKGSPVNKGVIELLKTEGALEFDKKVYIKRVTKYNSALYTRGLSQK